MENYFLKYDFREWRSLTPEQAQYLVQVYMLPAKWIRQADPFRRRNGTRDEHKHLDRIHEK